MSRCVPVCPTFERRLGNSREAQNGAPGETQRSGFVGARRSGEVSKFSPLVGGNEGYEARDDVGEHSVRLGL